MFPRSLSALFIAASLVCAVSASALPGPPQLALLTGNAQAADSWGWESCGETTDSVQIKSIAVSPDPPKIGADLTVTVDLQVEETIEEGATADVLVKVGRIKLLQQTFDLCDEARKANATVSCPVEPGVYSIVQTVALPKEVPKLKYVINVQGYTKDEEPLTCVDLTVQFRPFFQLWE